VGAHAGEIKGNKDITKDPDYGSIGIVLTGDFESRMANGWTPDKPSPQQLASLQTLLNRLTREYEIDPKSIVRHRDIEPGHTVCPGQGMDGVAEGDQDQTRKAHQALQQAQRELQQAQAAVDKLKSKPKAKNAPHK
jgi:N-acetyl-anhydromuramyl-L-alanine amidase AmpD